MLAPDGRCKAFDAAANGYVRGEGCGVVVLKPLSKALADGDPVYAVDPRQRRQPGRPDQRPDRPERPGAGSGPAGGLPRRRRQPRRTSTSSRPTAPARPSATRSRRRPWAASWPRAGPPTGPALLGSVKTNIGHLEAAAGIAGAWRGETAGRRAGHPTRAGATGLVTVRADSAFYSYPIIAAARRGGARFSITARLTPAVTSAITTIPDQAWTPIHYPNAIWDEQEQRLVSDAEVAETTFTAFTSRRKAEHVTARLIVRRVRRLNRATVAAGQTEAFAVYRYHAVFTDSAEPMLAAEATHRDHAIVEQIIADLKAPPWHTCPRGCSPRTPPGWSALRSPTTSPAPPARSPRHSTPAPAPPPCAPN